jgi:hypothetical protein
MFLAHHRNLSSSTLFQVGAASMMLGINLSSTLPQGAMVIETIKDLLLANNRQCGNVAHQRRRALSTLNTLPQINSTTHMYGRLSNCPPATFTSMSGATVNNLWNVRAGLVVDYGFTLSSLGSGYGPAQYQIEYYVNQQNGIYNDQIGLNVQIGLLVLNTYASTALAPSIEWQNTGPNYNPRVLGQRTGPNACPGPMSDNGIWTMVNTSGGTTNVTVKYGQYGILGEIGNMGIARIWSDACGNQFTNADWILAHFFCMLSVDE